MARIAKTVKAKAPAAKTKAKAPKSIAKRAGSARRKTTVKKVARARTKSRR